MQEKYKELREELASIGGWEIMEKFKQLPNKTTEQLSSDIFDLTILISNVLTKMEEIENKISNS